VQELALKDVDPAVRRRIFHLHRHPATLAALRQASSAGARGGGAGGGGGASTSAPADTAEAEDSVTVLQPLGVALSTPLRAKDRRQSNVKSLDLQALAVRTPAM
jgi:hypothetical protein